MSEKHETLMKVAYELVSSFGTNLQEWDAGVFRRVCNLWDEIRKIDSNRPLPDCLRHIHVGGREDDVCGKCGEDLRHEIHFRTETIKSTQPQTKPKVEGWWCPTCRSIIDGHQVTNSEHCEVCGTYLTDCQPPAKPEGEGASNGWISLELSKLDPEHDPWERNQFNALKELQSLRNSRATLVDYGKALEDIANNYRHVVGRRNGWSKRNCHQRPSQARRGNVMNEKIERYTVQVEPYDGAFYRDNEKPLSYHKVCDKLNAYETEVAKYRKALERAVIDLRQIKAITAGDAKNPELYGIVFESYQIAQTALKEDENGDAP